jgi:hypothetical protein
MGDARYRAVALFVQRVFGQSVFLEFFFIGYALEPDWITGIPDEAEVIWIDSNVKQLVQGLCLFRWKSKPLNQVFCTVDTATQEFLPKFHG